MIAIEYASLEALPSSRSYWEALVDGHIQQHVKEHGELAEDASVQAWIPHLHPRPSFTIMEEMKARYFLGGWAMRFAPDDVRGSFRGCIVLRRASAADEGDLQAA